jgi:regulatory protein
LEQALKFLRARDRFSAEVASHLLARGYGAEATATVLDHLVRRKLIDDRRTIQNLVARMSGRRAAGIEKLRAELAKRGAPEEIVDECLTQITPEDQRRAMFDVLRAKMQPTDDRARGARLLLSRGFSEDDIEGALDEFFQTD